MTTDVAVIEEDSTEVAEQVPLTKREATALTKKIKAASQKLADEAWDLLSMLEQAATGDIHVALGYKSWTEWFSDNVVIEVGDKDDRKALTQLMSGKGMSQRAIATSLGVDPMTVNRDLKDAGVENATPDGNGATVGLDGKTYTRKDQEPEEIIDGEVVDEEEPSTKRQALPAQLNDAVTDVAAAVDWLHEVSEDDRFAKGRKGFASKYLEDLQGSHEVLQEVIDKLTA